MLDQRQRTKQKPATKHVRSQNLRLGIIKVPHTVHSRIKILTLPWSWAVGLVWGPWIQGMLMLILTWRGGSSLAVSESKWWCLYRSSSCNTRWDLQNSHYLSIKSLGLCEHAAVQRILSPLWCFLERCLLCDFTAVLKESRLDICLSLQWHVVLLCHAATCNWSWLCAVKCAEMDFQSSCCYFQWWWCLLWSVNCWWQLQLDIILYSFFHVNKLLLC